MAVTGENQVNEESKRLYGKLYPVFQQLYRSLERDFDTITRKVEQLYE